ncbi:DUF4105 domain-containing protein [bacterium]|nr:MAG: DUF4105 domain-containing protein [bacterium]
MLFSHFSRLICFVSAFFLLFNFNATAQTQQALDGTYTKIYLAFAGPYASSPSSAFGHFFLVLEPDSSIPIHLWPAINFTADTKSYSSLEQFIYGIGGGLDGSYSVLPFHEKIREYANIESRSIWLLQLEFTPNEIHTFTTITQAYLDSSKTFAYRFHDKNCASYLTYHLFAASEKPITPSFTATPRDLLIQIIKKFHVHTIYRIDSIESTFDNNFIQTSINKNDNNLTPNDAKLLLPYYEWKLNQQKNQPSKEETAFLNKLRLITIEADSSKSNELLTRIPAKSFTLHNESALDFGVVNNSSKIPLLDIHYRFALHDFFDFSEIYSPNDYINLANLNFRFNQDSFVIQDFWLFKQISLSPSTPLVKRWNWSLGMGFNRLPVLSKKLSPTLVGGIGKSLGNTVLTTSFMVQGIIRYESGLKRFFTAKPELIQRISISNKIKLLHSFGYYLNETALKNPTVYYEYSLQAAVQLADESNLVLRSSFSKTDRQLALGLRFYF